MSYLFIFCCSCCSAASAWSFSSVCCWDQNCCLTDLWKKILTLWMSCHLLSDSAKLRIFFLILLFTSISVTAAAWSLWSHSESSDKTVKSWSICCENTAFCNLLITVYCSHCSCWAWCTCCMSVSWLLCSLSYKIY